MHELKIWSKYYADVASGSKTFEVRLDDRGYEVGDLLVLYEYGPDTKLPGNGIAYRRVTYIGRDMPGVMPGYVVMSIIPDETYTP